MNHRMAWVDVVSEHGGVGFGDLKSSFPTSVFFDLTPVAM